MFFNRPQHSLQMLEPKSGSIWSFFSPTRWTVVNLGLYQYRHLPGLGTCPNFHITQVLVIIGHHQQIPVVWWCETNPQNRTFTNLCLWWSWMSWDMPCEDLPGVWEWHTGSPGRSSPKDNRLRTKSAGEKFSWKPYFWASQNAAASNPT